jgi:hypothetical protein
MWTFIAAIAFCTVASASVQMPRDTSAQRPSLPKEITIDGTVEAVHENGLDRCPLCEACSDCRATHVVVRSDGHRIEVHLAPEWFLARVELSLSVGDAVRIVGSHMHLAKGRGLVAHQVHVDQTVYRLRDEYGLPLWRRLLTDTSATTRDSGR